MSQFKKKSLHKKDIPVSDTGVEVSELLQLLDFSKLPAALLEALDLETIKSEFIPIAGAQTLVKTQKRLNSRYHKIDLPSSLKDINFYNNGKFSINFTNVDHPDLPEIRSIKATPIYSAQRDFFSSLLQMDKFASSLISKGYRKILDENLRLVKEVHKTEHKYKYRILHDTSDNKYYLRAIISLHNYYNYDNNIAIVIGLLTLYRQAKLTDSKYSLRLCEYNESFIRMYFETDVLRPLEKIGSVKSIVEISNDEIKREALRFSGVCSIVFGQKSEDELFIRPQEIKSKILSIKHNQVPKTAVEELKNIDQANKIHKDLFNDISKISQIKNPDQIKFLVKSKVEKSKNGDIKKFRSDILKELTASVDNIVMLLTVFKKIQILASEDIEATEYLRYVLYQALIGRK